MKNISTILNENNTMKYWRNPDGFVNNQNVEFVKTSSTKGIAYMEDKRIIVYSSISSIGYRFGFDWEVANNNGQYILHILPSLDIKAPIAIGCIAARLNDYDGNYKLANMFGRDRELYDYNRIDEDECHSITGVRYIPYSQLVLANKLYEAYFTQWIEGRIGVDGFTFIKHNHDTALKRLAMPSSIYACMIDNPNDYGFIKEQCMKFFSYFEKMSMPMIYEYNRQLKMVCDMQIKKYVDNKFPKKWNGTMTLMLKIQKLKIKKWNGNNYIEVIGRDMAGFNYVWNTNRDAFDVEDSVIIEAEFYDYPDVVRIDDAKQYAGSTELSTISTKLTHVKVKEISANNGAFHSWKGSKTLRVKVSEIHTKEMKSGGHCYVILGVTRKEHAPVKWIEFDIATMNYVNDHKTIVEITAEYRSYNVREGVNVLDKVRVRKDNDNYDE